MQKTYFRFFDLFFGESINKIGYLALLSTKKPANFAGFKILFINYALTIDGYGVPSTFPLDSSFQNQTELENIY